MSKCNKYANRGGKTLIQRLRDTRRSNYIEIYENGCDDMEDVEFNMDCMIHKIY